ncbi:MAG: hypothetical protein K1Y02_24940 [Candidatus Hydrogenedentes bacterium]|nr:hypothetical protein [Candidatus Hydrogenedentota bacterium]
MTDAASERLKEFREQNRAAAESRLQTGRAARFFMGAAILLVVAASSAWIGFGLSDGNVAAGGLTAEQWRKYALKLEEKQLPTAAMDAYDRYLEHACLTDEARAKTCFSVAKIAIEEKQYERALAYLYEAEMLAPDSDVKDELNKKVVLCLEKLGRTSALQRELETRSTARRTAKDIAPEEIVLAEFGGEVITDKDLEREIERMPEADRAAYSAPEKRAEFLRNLVIQRVLIDKALRQELDADKEVQAQLEAQRNSLIVHKLLASEVQQKISVTKEDVERFYKAEPDHFKAPNSGDVLPFDQVRDRAERILRMKKSDEETRVFIDKVLAEKDAKFFTERLKPAEGGT